MVFESLQPNLEDALRLFEHRLNKLRDEMVERGETSVSSTSNETAGDFLGAIQAFTKKDSDVLERAAEWVEGAIDPDFHLSVEGEGNQAILTFTLKEEE